MSPTRSPRSAVLPVAASAALAALLLSGCTGPDGDRPIVVGTTLELSSVDPAAVSDPEAAAILHQLYPRLVERDGETGELLPALAETAFFTSETEFTVTLPEGLEFANGHRLTASDVVFSFERQFAIPSGVVTRPLLSSLAEVSATDASTVVFSLSRADPGFPAVLAGPAGAILDEEVFSADAITPTEAVVGSGGFGGPLQLAAVDGRSFAFAAADADPAVPSSRRLVLETGASGEELASRLGSGLDAAFGELTAAEHDALAAIEGVTTRTQPSGALQLLAFDFSTQPFGTGTDDPGPLRAAAVRQAVADLVDREALAAVAPDSWLPAYGYLPDSRRIAPLAASTAPGQQGVLAGESFGDGLGGPDPERAAQRLAAVGITTPVLLQISWFGADPDAAALIAELEEQLEEGGLFALTVAPQDGPLDRSELSEERFPLLELNWEPRGVGLDSYFTPLYSSASGLPIGIGDGETDELIARLRAATGADERAQLVQQIEARLASSLPAIPLLTGQYTLYLAPGAAAAASGIPELEWFDSLGGG